MHGASHHQDLRMALKNSSFQNFVSSSKQNGLKVLLQDLTYPYRVQEVSSVIKTHSPPYFCYYFHLDQVLFLSKPI